VIRLRDVQFAYRPGESVLNNVTLEIGPGLTLLVGPNGSGKSTLLKVICGIERPDLGTAAIDGFDLWTDEINSRRALAYIPEHADLTPYASIREILHLVCRLRIQPLTKTDEVLRRAGLLSVADRSVRELSMGQRRRVLVAAAWIGMVTVAVLDEPLETMDQDIRGEILSWVEQLRLNGATIVVATHQLEPFIETATRAVTMRAGQCRLVQPLPEDRTVRIQLLESMASGRW